VSDAALVVADPTEFVNTARYCLPLSPEAAMKLSVVDVAPAMSPNDPPGEPPAIEPSAMADRRRRR